VNDVTDQITALLTKAAGLAIAASGNRTGKYALIAQITVDPDGTYIVEWQRYGP
jgi:hypothetical protein